MLDIKFIRENPNVIKKTAEEKLVKIDVDRLLELDKIIKENLSEVEKLRAKRNLLSSLIPNLKNKEKQEKVNEVKGLKEKISEIEEKLVPVQEEFNDLMLRVPNPTLPEVPVGKSDEENVEIKRVGEIRNFTFEAKSHVDICAELNLADFAHASKIAGARTYYLKNEALLLEMALCRYVMDKLVKKGFQVMSVPVLVKDTAMKGTGYFPIGKEQAYEIQEDQLYLVGTSEVSLISYHNDEIVNVNENPILYAGYSNCFRREAGTYGKDTKGFYRVHQFTKIEQIAICKADFEEQARIHNFLLGNAEEILQDLKIPYRVVKVCTGDIGLGQVKKHDIESWMPSRNSYSETHSCSSFNDFQARRSNIKYKDENGELKYAFTLNNTAIASPRILIPIIENYQNEDGSITIPEVLVPYMGGMTKIEKRK